MKNNILFVFLIIISGCNTNVETPKTKGYPKYTFPNKIYTKTEITCPFYFEYPNYAIIEKLNKCNFNLVFPEFNAKIYFTYIELENNLQTHVNQTKEYIKTHQIKLENVLEKEYEEANKTGVLFLLKGNIATSRHFFLTDKKKHFIRGALYFEEEINDSIKPVESFLTYDIIKIIETLKFN